MTRSRRRSPCSSGPLGLNRTILPVLGLIAIVSCGDRDDGDDPRRDLIPVRAFARLSKPGDLSEANFTQTSSFLSSRWSPSAGLGVPAQDPVGQPLRRTPYGLSLSADSSKLYVTFPGNEAEPLRAVGVIDTSPGGGLVREILVGRRPLGIELSPNGRFVVVANEYSNYLSVIDTATDRVVQRSLSRFYNQEVIFLSPTQAAVTNRAWDSLDLYTFDPASGEMEMEVEVPLYTRNRPFEIGQAPTDGPPMAVPDGTEDLTMLGLPTGSGEAYDIATERLLTKPNPRECAPVRPPACAMPQPWPLLRALRQRGSPCPRWPPPSASGRPPTK